jgi:predicted RNA-binding protein with PUA-like domain
MGRKNYWLMKSEGESYGIGHLKKDKKTAWSGVRNYQARNFMMQGMQVGDSVFFYHSNGAGTEPTGIYGLARVASAPHADETQFDTKSDYFDSRATKAKPIWYCVDVQYVKTFKSPIPLSEIKLDPRLAGMRVREVGSRLSIQPVSTKHGEYLLALAK